MEAGPQNIKCNIEKTKYIQKKSLLSEIKVYDIKLTSMLACYYFIDLSSKLEIKA